MGIEPISYPWEGYVLPLNYAHITLQLYQSTEGIKTAYPCKTIQ